MTGVEHFATVAHRWLGTLRPVAGPDLPAPVAASRPVIASPVTRPEESTVTSTNAPTPNIEKFRKRPIEVEMMLWDGTLERLVAIQQWIGPASDDPEAGPGFAGMVGPYPAELWVEHSQSWVSVPVGHRIAKEADGNGFYPISPAAIAETFESVSA